jgi:rubredoxin
MAIAIALQDVKGSAVRRDIEGGALQRTNFIESTEAGAPQAFMEGLKGLVVSFPRGQAKPEVATAAESGTKTWQCVLCAFVYDEAAGLPEEGIAPGTSWQDVPENWSCPDCAATKRDFQMIEL